MIAIAIATAIGTLGAIVLIDIYRAYRRKLAKAKAAKEQKP